MMIALNSRQKEVAQREGEAVDRRKGGQTGTPTPGADDLTGSSRSGLSDASNRRKGFHSTGRAEGLGTSPILSR